MDSLELQKNVWIRFCVEHDSTPFFRIATIGDVLPKDISINKNTNWENIQYFWGEDDEEVDEKLEAEEDEDDDDDDDYVFNPKSLYTITRKDDRFTDSNKFHISVEIREGELLKTAQVRKIDIVLDNEQLNLLLKFVFGTLFFLFPEQTKKTRKFVFNIDAHISENQELTLSGIIKLQGKKILEFNESGFKLNDKCPTIKC